MPLPSPPFHEPEAIKHPVADGKEPSIGEILPVILGPNITGKLFIPKCGEGIVDKAGSFQDSYNGRCDYSGHSSGDHNSFLYIVFDASNSNSQYKDTNSIQPSALVFNYVIKY